MTWLMAIINRVTFRVHAGLSRKKENTKLCYESKILNH